MGKVILAIFLIFTVTYVGYSFLDTIGTQGSIGFDGIDDYVTIADHADFNLTGDFTIEFDVLIGTWSGPQQNIFGKYRHIENNRKVSVDAWGSGSLFRANFGNATGNFDGSVGVLYPSTSAPIGQWFHVAITYNDNGQQQMFINGEREAVSTDATGGTKDTADPIYLGIYQVSLASPANINMDNIRIWADEIRTQKEIQHNMKKAIYHRTTNLKLNLRVEKATGSILDYSGNGHHARRVVGTTSYRNAPGVIQIPGN